MNINIYIYMMCIRFYPDADVLSLSFCANSLVTVKKCSQTRPYVVVVVVVVVVFF